MSSNKNARQSTSTLSPDERRCLLDLAWASIRHGLRTGRPASVDLFSLSPALRVPRASFVTLEKQGHLRGCIGSLQASRPLAQDVAENAYAAAFRDSRFPPVAADEIADLTIHLSLLTPPELINCACENDLIAQLRPGIDGLIVEDGWHKATFLPAVWEALPDPKEFLRHLKRKAGLPDHYWSPQFKAYRYYTEVIEEENPL